MSAINQQPSLIDRAGELRTDPAMLDELLKRAKVLSVGGGKVSANLASAKLVYPNAQSDENYFLGIDRATDTPYFFAKGFSLSVEDRIDRTSCSVKFERINILPFACLFLLTQLCDDI